jgi:hypothetical protein
VNQITIAREGAPAPLSTPESDPSIADSHLLTFLAHAVRDPAIDVAKLESLLRLQREVIADNARLQFDRAMAAAQAEMQPVLRNARNEQTNSRYADLEAIDAAIRPIYARHGFSLSFTEVPTDAATVRMACIVRCAGHAETYHLEAALDTAGPKGTGNKTPVQGLGSSVSYLRRYLTVMIFNVVLSSDDNDGQRQHRNEASTGLLTHSQKMDLKGLMRDTRTLESRFLEVMCPDIRAIEEVPASDFPRLRNALLTKAGVLRQRAKLAGAQS